MHPHRHDAMRASRTKARAITGHAGGGHAHLGASHRKRADHHGVQRSWDGHRKTYSEPVAIHSGKSKHRLDKFARGGRAKRKGDVNVAIVMPHHGERTQPTPFGAGIASAPAPAPRAMPGGPPMPPMGGGMPAGAGAPPVPGGAGLPPGMGMGGGGGFAKGGRARGKEHQPKPMGDMPYDMAHWERYAAMGRTPPSRGRNPTQVPPSRARGGKVLAGKATGVGRLEDAERYHHRGRR